MTRATVHRRARSHEVSDPLTQPSHRGPPLPGFHLPGSRCALTLTMRLGALLPRQPPWCLSTRCAHGTATLQSLTWQWSRRASQRSAVPRAIDHAGPMSTIIGSRCFERTRGGLASGHVPQPVGMHVLGFTQRSCFLALLGFSSLGLSPSVLRPQRLHAILCRLPCSPAFLRTNA